MGAMIESHLVEGRQDYVPGRPAVYGQSITDACLSFEQTEPLIERFVELLRAEGVPVQTGVFRAHMLVEIHNDGPVTIILDSPPQS